jgi:hypothetical protein
MLKRTATAKNPVSIRIIIASTTLYIGADAIQLFLVHNDLDQRH